LAVYLGFPVFGFTGYVAGAAHPVDGFEALRFVNY